MNPREALLILPGEEITLARSLTQLEQSPLLKDPQESPGLTLPGSGSGPRPAGVEIAGSFALVHVSGILGRNLPWYAEYFGFKDQNTLADAFTYLAGLDEIQTVILRINSPGGMATGTPETAQRIRELSAEGKRVIAWVDHCGASAAYWLAAAADSIWMIPSGRVGSIGCVSSFFDVAKMLDGEGVKLEVFTSAEGKVRGMYGRATTEKDREVFAASVNKWGGQFRDYVAARRPAVGPESPAWSGETFDGEEALALGLVDGTATTLEAAILGDLELPH